MIYFYVSQSGSDSNDGLLPATPFLHIQKAVDSARASGDACSISLADGTYTESVSMFGAAAKSDQIPISGNSAHPENVLWVAPAGTICLSVQDEAISTVSGIDFSAPNGGVCLMARQHAVVDFSNVRFGAASVHCSASVLGVMQATGNYTIYGSPSGSHIEGNILGAALLNGVSVSVPNALTFSYFAKAINNSFVTIGGATFSGAGAGTGSTGARQLTAAGGIIDLGGSTLPGNA